MTKEQTIARLQYYVTNLSAQSMQHRIEGKIFASQGFSKLGEKYKDHAEEEMGWVDKMIDRILDLDATPALEQAPSMPVCTNIVDLLKMDKQISIEGIAALRKDTVDTADDYATFDIFKAYLLDEEEDLNWTKQQLDLIECIGIQNWLSKQL
ncbi:MAG: hypothetical protein K6C31_05225 [Bacteroidales bacterium]|nr:hypothetical protein [Bacteroidales bacterium]